MKQKTRDTILINAKTLFALNGYEGFSIRILAKKGGVGLSSIYHFFEDKDQILNEIFDSTRKELGVNRSKLPNRTTAREMLKDRIEFQFVNIEDIVFVLKYYLHFRPNFLRIDSGYVPKTAYLHVEEVLELGVNTKEFTISSQSIDKESKVVAHAINGFLLEYYPHTPSGKELEELVNAIHEFLMRSLTNKEVQIM